MPTKTRLCDNAEIRHVPAGALSVRFLPALPLLSNRQALPRSPVHRLSAPYRYPLSPHTNLTFQAALRAAAGFFEESASLPADPSTSHSERICLHSEDRSLPALAVRLFEIPNLSRSIWPTNLIVIPCFPLPAFKFESPVKEKSAFCVPR